MNYSKLRNVVENSKLTISELCKKLEIDRKTFYNNFENRTMKVETLEKICFLLEVPITNFFENEPKKTALSIVAEESEVYGVTNYKEKYFETLEKLNACNERLLGFTDLKKGSIKK